jgi:hypothetical protein
VAVGGFFSVTFAVALAAHTAIGIAQSVGLPGGDYASHPHQALFPLGLASLTAGLSAIFLYAVHLAGAGFPSLPSLARSLRTRIGWQSFVAIALGAGLVLVGMESAEQLAAGRYDGLLSAFGGSPGIGLGLILLFSAAGNALLRALCNWFAGAHARITHVLSYLFRRRGGDASPARERSRRTTLPVFRYACDAPQALGKRGPPILVR